MKFSIVIPVFNRAALVGRALSSALNQSLPPLEIIVVDDGSTDNSKEVITQFTDRHEGIILISQTNSERGAARNRGFEAATGDYVVFFDSDDEMMPHYLETLSSYILCQSERPVIVAAKFALRDGEKRSTKPHKDQRTISGVFDYKLFLIGNPMACHFAVSKTKPLHPFHEDRRFATAEDWLFLFRNTTEYPIHIIDEVCVIMHRHEAQSMNSHLQVIDARLKAQEWICTNLALTSDEIRRVRAHTNRFLAIHYCDAGKRFRALNSLIKAVGLGLFDKVILYTFLRTFLGNGLMRFLATIIQNDSK